MQQLHTHLKMSFFIFYFNFKLHVYHDNDSMHVNIYAHLYPKNRKYKPTGSVLAGPKSIFSLTWKSMVWTSSPRGTSEIMTWILCSWRLGVDCFRKKLGNCFFFSIIDFLEESKLVVDVIIIYFRLLPDNSLCDAFSLHFASSSFEVILDTVIELFLLLHAASHTKLHDGDFRLDGHNRLLTTMYQLMFRSVFIHAGTKLLTYEWIFLVE